MIFNLGIILNAVLFALGAYWCYEMVGRWHSDLDELRTNPDNLARATIIGMWLLTAAIGLFVVNFAWGLAANIFFGVKGLL